nr:unnamed protein product [Callosobruchus chinensis]CAH7756557.1 unnamed protein product [Callosobruchus chinensis]CAH7758386.1 unnamed protein product [Callosobruchus chinensis]
MQSRKGQFDSSVTRP